MIHFKDQSEQLLEGAPAKSINIPPPEHVFLHKAQNAAKTISTQRINRLEIHGSETTAGVTNTGKAGNGYCSHINSFNIR